MNKEAKIKELSLKMLRKPKMVEKFTRKLATERPNLSSRKKLIQLPPLHLQSESKGRQQILIAKYNQQNQEEGIWTQQSPQAGINLCQSIEFNFEQTACFPTTSKQTKQTCQTENNKNYENMAMTFGKIEPTQIQSESKYKRKMLKQILNEKERSLMTINYGDHCENSFKLNRYEDVYRAVRFNSEQLLPVSCNQQEYRVKTPLFRGETNRSRQKVHGNLPPLPRIMPRCL